MNRQKLAHAKVQAVKLLNAEHRRITCAFCKYLERQTRPCNVIYNHIDAKRRISEAVFMDVSDCLDREERGDEIYGETDGDQIWINPWCTRHEMVMTLIHEALHDSVHIVRPTRRGKCKGLNIKQEHDVMKTLDCCI